MSTVTPPRIYSGMDLVKALRIAKDIGCQVVPVRRTGEIRVSHADALRSCLVNARRKDCSRRLVVFLRRILTIPQDHGARA